MNTRNLLLFASMALLIVLEGTTTLGGIFGGSWNTALFILNFGLLSAIIALGLNMQWGYAGLFNSGIVGFVALGGLAPVLISTAPVPEVWTPSGAWQVILALVLGAGVIALAVQLNHRLRGGARALALGATLIGGFFLFRAIFDPAVEVIEAFDPEVHSNLGGLGLPVLLSWPVGAAFAAGAAWLIGKTALGLRSDYLAIATLGIGEILVSVLKNEDWLARGVKLVTQIPRPVPYEYDLQANAGFAEISAHFGADPVAASTIAVKLLYAALFCVILLALIWASESALRSPWGRMMRAIRDNETAARAMGKDVTRRHLQIFILGCAVFGLAGAMMVTMDSLHNPGTYNPLRFTFLIWVMVIAGGSGNNWGTILGAFLISFIWLKVEAWGPAALDFVASGLQADSPLREHLRDAAAHMRVIVLGIVLILVLKFRPKGIIPERQGGSRSG